ncbi:MAG: chlorophyll synthase ChlG [Pseudomonadota bacterium]
MSEGTTTTQTYAAPATRALPSPRAVLELYKPITWFPPMWAYACGAISVGANLSDRWLFIIGGIILAGPLVCGTSQAINDWYDRHVDAINEPHRVIPSGRMPGNSALIIAVIGTVLAFLFSTLLGFWVTVAAVIGLAAAWAYSAPPVRLKLNGWYGNGIVGISYETLPWVTAGAAALGTLPSPLVLIVALLYGVGAHGILTINDFKAIKGDTEMGVATLPVQLGAKRAAIVCAAVMIAPQLAVITLLSSIGAPVHAAVVIGLVVAQAIAARRFIASPEKFAVWYSAVGVGLYVLGMMVTAFALRGHTITAGLGA